MVYNIPRVSAFVHCPYSVTFPYPHLKNMINNYFYFKQLVLILSDIIDCPEQQDHYWKKRMNLLDG